jgi:hypothetical protein
VKDEFLKLAEETLSKIEDDVPPEAVDKALDFFESVSEKISDMVERVEAGAPVTEGMMQALQNMSAGVDKWIP